MISLRDDIVLETVDGIRLLVALRPAWGTCPFAMPVIPVYADIWQAIKDGCDEEAVIAMLTERKGFTAEKAEHVLSSFIASAGKNHYLAEEEKADADAGHAREADA